MSEVTLPAMPDDHTQSFGWHALNYRTAHTIHAAAMFDELEKFVQAYAREAVLLERERCARVCEDERLDDPTDNADDIAYDMAIRHCASAIRNG